MWIAGTYHYAHVVHYRYCFLVKCDVTPVVTHCGGKSVYNKSHVCDYWIEVPLGMLPLSGMCSAGLMVNGAVADNKFIVQPESGISVSSVVDVNMVGVHSEVNANLSNLRSITLAAPPHYYVLHAMPPMVLSLVIISWCPSFIALQVLLVCSL
jgi:hypothetical protein